MGSLEGIEEDSVGRAAEDFEGKQFDVKVNAMGKRPRTPRGAEDASVTRHCHTPSTMSDVTLYWLSACLFNNRLVVMKQMVHRCTIYQ